MNLLILGAGYAMRLRPRTETIAKPLIHVAGRAMVDHVLDAMAPIEGLRRTVLISNNRFFGDYESWLERAERRTRALTPVLLNNGSNSPEDKKGAIGDLHHSMHEADLFGDDLIVVGGDNLFTHSQEGFVQFSQDKPAVIATYDVGCSEIVKRFASRSTHEDGRIHEFCEKPTDPRTTVAGTAFYFFKAETLSHVNDYIDEGRNPDNAGFLFQYLFPRIPTYACPIEGHWYDIGCEGTLEDAHQTFSNRFPQTV